MARTLRYLVLAAALLVLSAQHASASSQLGGEPRRLVTNPPVGDGSTINGSTLIQSQQLTPVPVSSHEGEGVTSETTAMESSDKTGMIAILIAVVVVVCIVAGFLLFISKRRQQARDRISTIMDAGEAPYRSEIA